MEALPEDSFPDMDEIHSKTLFSNPCQARPKKRVLKQWTVFDVESPHQNIINSKILKPGKSLPSCQTMKDTMFQEGQKPTPANLSISGQTVKSLNEIKENIEDEQFASKEASNQRDASLKSFVRNFPDLDSCKNTGKESDTNNKKFQNVMDQPAQKTSNIPVTNESSRCLINDFTKGTENHLTEDQYCFPDISVLSPNMCFIDSDTPPTNHDRSFSLANTSSIDLETPPTAADTSISGKNLEMPATKNSKILKTPMNFSTVTVSELGISPETFTFKSSGKSSLNKYRRRSTVGLRGSPETNCLIRYIARQKSEHPEDPCDMVSPFRPGRHSCLKEKISAFRASFLSVEESEQNVASTGFLEDSDLCAQSASIKSPFLKPRKGPDLREESPSALRNASITDQSDTCAVNKPVLNEQLLKSIPCPGSGVCCSRATDTDVFAGSPILVPTKVKCSTAEVTAKTEGQANGPPAFWKRAFAMGSKTEFTKHLTPEKCERSLQPSLPLLHEGSPADVQASPSPFLRPALKKTPAEQGKEHKVHLLFSLAEERSLSSDFLDASVAKSPKLESSKAVVLEGKGNNEESKEQKRKKVTFGRALSPEIFDKTLPANTPLRKGRTPDNHSSQRKTKIPAEALSPVRLEPITQPNFDNAEECDESSGESFPVLPGAENCKSSDAVTEHNTTSSDVSEDVDCEVISTSGVPGPPLEPELLMKIDAGPSEEPQDFAGAVAECNSEETTCKESTVSEGGRITRSAMKRKCAEYVESSPSNDSINPEATNKEDKLVPKNPPQTAKRKPPGKKRTTKVRSGRKKGRGKKSQKAVYGARETVSKKPLLSPIFEVPEVLSSTPSTSPAWGLALVQEDSSESSDGSRDPQTSRKVTRRKRSARRPDPRYANSSEDSTSEESESDQESDSEATSWVEESMNVRGFGSPETLQVSYKDQTVNENESTDVVLSKSLEDAPARSCELTGDSSVGTALPEVKENKMPMVLSMQGECANTTDLESNSSIKELPQNIPLGSTIPRVLNITKSQRRQSRRLSLQVSGPSAAAKETTPSVPISRMKKLRRVSCETSKTPSDASGQVPEGEKNSPVSKMQIDTSLTGSGISVYSQDYILPIKSDDATEGDSRKSSKNSRRNTIFCFHSDNVLECVPALAVPPLEGHSVPPSMDDPEADESDHSFNIETTFQNTATRDRAVRRSMRLRRSSGIVGLGWINESAPEKENCALPNTNRKLRRSKVNTPALKESNSPARKPNVAFSSPGKENCQHSPLPCLSVKSTRRRTLCTSTIQEHSLLEVRKKRKGSRPIKVDALCPVKADQAEHPAENKMTTS